MLLLVVTAAVSLLPGAASLLENAQRLNLTQCPINYYGEIYNEALGLTTENVFTLFFGNLTGSDFMRFIFEDLVDFRDFGSIFIVANETSEFVQNLPDLVGTSPCFYFINLFSSNLTSTTTTPPIPPPPTVLDFRTFGQQGAYRVTSPVPLTVTTTVSGQPVNTTELSAGETYAYLSGCRHEGQFFPPGTETCASETVFVTCNSTAFLTVSTEDPRCPRKSMCIVKVIWSPSDETFR
ncbi:uncharacterized protein LOC144030464 isoform X2 [Festucalex cinctus]